MFRSLLGVFLLAFGAQWAAADLVDEAELRDAVIAPYSLGEPTDINGVWELLNGSGAREGYVIQSEAISPLPGFSGAAINMMVLLDMDGGFIDVKLLNQSEPIFVSGMGEAPFRQFLEQYRGLSINTPITIGTNYGSGGGGSLVYLDGVTKATASVRIAHESIMAAAREVARQKLKGIARPQEKVVLKPDLDQTFTWDQLVEEGIARHVVATHGEVRGEFAGTTWQSDDPFPGADDGDPFIDLWIVDVTAPPVAKAVMGARMLRDWERLGRISPDDQTLLLIEAGDHGLVSEDFVRNTAPSWIEAKQDDFPVSMMDADLLIDLKEGLPDGQAMVLRLDRRLGFNPVREWQLSLLAIRYHGMLQPQEGQARFSWMVRADERFFDVLTPPKPLSPFESALVNRRADLLLLGGFLVLVFALMTFNRRFVRRREYRLVRYGVLAATLGLIGWWGQGQLSILTPIATLSAAMAGKSLSFLLYDPFSLVIWIAAIIGFFIWGRALFCGWLCPFGAMQEFVGAIAKRLGVRQLTVSGIWDRRLKLMKYAVLAGLVATLFYRPEHVETAAEVEPFKTAISVFFQREWYYVFYAMICLFASAVVFKAYCRYLCPLGALMAIGGWLRLTPWIERRAECGSPCQLCKVKCDYKAIKTSGKIDYSECFGCLECVDIYEDRNKCVPLIVTDKKRVRVS
ncbi:4Fe-4S binding protein [Aliiroseovarius sp. PrR006]|nr:4Fe-4S binding protein [Aliiroseovarius sp. PrR006]NDW52770.1 4Fe-4S binding protein [Aliiroseovarius sp. PrR006]